MGEEFTVLCSDTKISVKSEPRRTSPVYVVIDLQFIHRNSNCTAEDLTTMDVY